MKVRKLQEFQDIFNTRLSKAKNKDVLIDNELKQIDIFIHTEGSNNSRNDILYILAEYDNLKPHFDRIYWLNPINGNFDTFIRYYDDYLMNEIESPIPEYEFNDDISQAHRNAFIEGIKDVRLQAIAFAKYALWLKELKSDTPKKESHKKEGLSLKQRILVLHYLGLDLNQTYKTTLSEVLSLVIGLDESNTKKGISELLSANKEKDIKTNENLLKMLEVFDNKSFTDIKLKINKDLEKFGVSD